jgi:UDP-N-acetylmuramyl pentapeptide phosphotransferase/UDP-N-acetylglucosamine-1-phosphate transferase
MNIFLRIAIPVLISFVAVNWVYFKVLRIAKKKQIVDNPNARKLQKTPVPILGGIAVFFGIETGVLGGVATGAFVGVPFTTEILPVFCALSVMIYCGAMDDIIGLTPRSRFIIEILTIAAVIFASGRCVDSLHGLWGITSFNWWVAVPLTVVAGVGIINAVNMIDGVNGLSSGLCILCSILFGNVFFRAGDTTNAIAAFTVASSLLPFFIHNVFGNKSRMFIGDAGTMMMGMLMTWFVISLLDEESLVEPVWNGKPINLIALALAILSVPVFDTVRVMTMRIIQGKSPFNPDKTHLHHVFVHMGVSHTITALCEIFIDLLVVGLLYAMVYVGIPMDWQLYLVVLVSILLVWGLFFFLRWHENHHTELMHRLANISVKTHLGHKEWWLFIERRLDRLEEHDEQKDETEPPEPTKPEAFDPTYTGNLKELDRKRVLEFMKGKAEVYVDDIKKRSGANPLRVDILLDEGILNGTIICVKEAKWGMPIIVTLAEEK